MDDMEKNRVGYVTQIETQLEHALAELAKYKPLAEKWEPKANGAMDLTEKEVRITLAFGGKRITATFPVTMFAENNAHDVTNAVCETMVKNLVMDHLRAAVEPEVQRLVTGAKSIVGAGKW